MNNQMNPELRQKLLMRVSAQAGRDAVTDDAMPFTCFVCGKPCEDWDGSECETCGEFHCDDHLVADQRAMAPECCLSCDHEAAAMRDTHGTLQRPD